MLHRLNQSTIEKNTLPCTLDRSKKKSSYDKMKCEGSVNAARKSLLIQMVTREDDAVKKKLLFAAMDGTIRKVIEAMMKCAGLDKSRFMTAKR
ncbi:hypothetical protein EYC84_007909 [Monilinia fructicola]|uniref:Uncharacterized protein n=1 Tax=Monilinia fructicola TaxID=38448 RepID=A0A5M9JKM1_MONFR|nr:hypothetical protein EYC84_007909 [Monilinia fructicola]